MSEPENKSIIDPVRLNLVDPESIRSQHLEQVLLKTNTPWGLVVVELEKDENGKGGLTAIEGGQVRESDHRAPKGRVEEYSTRIAAGSYPPPIIANKQGYIANGNTTLAALLRQGFRTYAIYQIDVSNLDKMIQIGALANEGPLPITPGEKLRAVERDLANGYTDSSIASMYGVNPKMVQKLRAEHRFDKRAEKLGIDPQALKTKAKSILVGLKLDAPFAEALQLVEDAQLSVTATKEVIKNIDEVGSEAEQLSVIAKERALRQQQIDALNRGGKARVSPPLCRQARSRYSWFQKRTAHELVDLDPAFFWDTKDKIEAVADLLTRVLVELKNAEPNMPPRPVDNLVIDDTEGTTDTEDDAFGNVENPAA